MASSSAACCTVGLLFILPFPNGEAFMFPGGTGTPALARIMPQSVANLAASRHLMLSSSGAWRCGGLRRWGERSAVGLERQRGVIRPRSAAGSTRCASQGSLDMEGSVGDGGDSSAERSQTGRGAAAGAGSGGAGQEDGAAEVGGWEDDMREADDAEELTKEFYSAVATRWNTTVEGAMEVEKELQLDRSIYDELRARRDFGFEQDLGLELKKRNLTRDAEETKEILEGLDALPGVSATTTVLPSQDLTPREVISSVMEALKNNNRPYINHGVEVFVRFLSPTSAMHGVSLEGVARYLGEHRNRALMHWDALAYPRPLALSGLKKNKAFQPVKLKDCVTGKWHPVSVYLTLNPRTNFWLIESLIVKGDM